MGTEIIIYDSDSMIEYLRRNNEMVDMMEELGLDKTYINSIVKAEVQNKAIDKHDLQLINKRVEFFPVIPFDSEISDLFEKLFKKYVLGYRPSIPDLIIAATAISYDCQLFTLNQNHFLYIPGLRMINHEIKPLPRTKGSWFKEK